MTWVARLSPPGRLLVLRGVIAWGVIACAALVSPWWGGCALVSCVWIDAASGWLARRRCWTRSPLLIHGEPLVDFLCFVWAPVAWIGGSSAAASTLTAAGIFVLAGIYRLARFQVEGLVGGRYRGLPVTYNGYLIPLAALVSETILPQPAWVWPIVLIAIALLMVSTRFTVPEL